MPVLLRGIDFHGARQCDEGEVGLSREDNLSWRETERLLGNRDYGEVTA